MIDFKGAKSPVLSKLLLHVWIQDQAMMSPFQVPPTKTFDWKLLLGRTWMQQMNFQMDWETQCYTLKVCSFIFTRDLAKRLDPPSTLVEETTPHAQAQHNLAIQSTTWIVDESNPTSTWWTSHCSRHKAMERNGKTIGSQRHPIG